jgi:hypothetical protein
MNDGPDQADAEQLSICDRFGVRPFSSPRNSELGIARNARENVVPLNGLRHPPESDNCRWYILAGVTLRPDPDFFVPLHVEHLYEWCPEAVPYLGLPPGCCFLLSPDVEDVWEDRTLLHRHVDDLPR